MRYSCVIRFWLGGLFFMAALVALRSGAAPINDNYTNRIQLVGTNLTVQGNNYPASTEPGEDTGSGLMHWYYSVWYGWTAPASGVVYLSATTTEYNFFPSVRAYRGSAVNALLLAATTLDGGIPVTAGDTIAIQVASISYFGGGGGGSGAFSLGLSLQVPAPTSPNDDFANRLAISTPSYHLDGSIYGATHEAGEPLPAMSMQQTLWWRITPPEDGLLTLLVWAPQFVSVLSVYEGTNLNSLLWIGSSGSNTYRLSSNHEYAVQLATDYVPVGSFTLDARFYSLTNDSFSGSTHLEGTNVTAYANTLLASLEPGEPQPYASNTVWFSWAAPATGRAQLIGDSVGIFIGPIPERLQPVRTVGCGNSSYCFLAIAGTVYHFQLSGRDRFGSPLLAVPIQLWPYYPCPNDPFVSPHVVKGMVITQEWLPATDATMELAEPSHLGSVPAKSLWWQWQAPVHGSMVLDSSGSLATNVVLAVYQGTSIEALTLVGKGTNRISFPCVGGTTFAIAAALPADAIGDVAIYGQHSGAIGTSIPVPGNILQEPSWEGTSLNPHFWRRSGGISGYVNERGGADGTTWPSLNSGTTIWQDVSTVPGHLYAIQFAFQAGTGGMGDTMTVRSLWDGQVVGSTGCQRSEGFWHWGNFTWTASTTNSQVAFQNTSTRSLDMDAFSVVDSTAPPSIVTQPSSVSTIAGGTAAFAVGVKGSLPLAYQWFFNSSVLPDETNRFLVMESVTAANVGAYRVTITNSFGAITSAVASLIVEAPTNATILVQPYGDTVPLGGYFSFSVVAAGTPPLAYQWFQNDQPVTGATNRTLTLTNVQTGDAGIYHVSVHNLSATVRSLPATLNVVTNVVGGGTINFRNRFFLGPLLIEAPVFDVDGVTRLSGTNYVAQLYAGPSLAALRPAGQPTPFRDAFSAGLFISQIVTLADIPPYSNVVVQARVWESSRGSSYEEARALGGKFGRSEILQVVAGADVPPPQQMQGLQSFSLQAGLPYFSVGRIDLVQRHNAVIVWSLTGEPGFLYLVEKSETPRVPVWFPYVVLTNVSGVVLFTDADNSASHIVMYRGRILD